MMIGKPFAFSLLVALGLWQVKVTSDMRSDRDDKYRAALLASRRTGKPLLVVGGPYGSPVYSYFFGPAHGCGDT